MAKRLRLFRQCTVIFTVLSLSGLATLVLSDKVIGRLPSEEVYRLQTVFAWVVGVLSVLAVASGMLFVVYRTFIDKVRKVVEATPFGEEPDDEVLRDLQRQIVLAKSRHHFARDSQQRRELQRQIWSLTREVNERRRALGIPVHSLSPDEMH